MIPIVSREEITDNILSYLEVDGLYITSAQDKVRYLRNTFPANTPFGTSGTHSPLEIVVENVVRGLTDYYGLSATSGDYNHISLYGDVEGSGTSAISTTISNNVITTAKLVNNSVTLAKLATMATVSFLGRTAAGTGNVEVIPLTAISPYIDVSDDINTAVAAAIADLDLTDPTIELTGDVTGSGTGSFAATIADGVVTFAKMQDVSTDTFVGRDTAGTGDLESLSVSTVKTMLSLNNVENTALSTWAGSTNLLRGGNFVANQLSAIGNSIVVGDLLVSGDFFNSHASILADGVISTDNIIYTEYLEVYNTATFDADVNVLGHEIVTGWLNVSGALSVADRVDLYDILILHETGTSNYGGFNVGVDAFETFNMASNLPICISPDNGYGALFLDGKLHVGSTLTQPSSTIHCGGSFASGWIAHGSNTTLGDVSFISITAACTLTLPRVSACAGRAYYLCRVYSGGSDSFIVRDGTDQIETLSGVDTSYGLYDYAKYTVLVSDGTSTWRMMIGIP